MASGLRARVRMRAAGRCEYCRLPDSATILPHALDHIRPRKHRGPTALDNLCYACAYCNAAKGANIAGFDPNSDALVALFHPRLDRWAEHFRWNGAVLNGRSATGRATIDVLRINDPERIEHRRLLIEAGVAFDYQD